VIGTIEIQSCRSPAASTAASPRSRGRMSSRTWWAGTTISAAGRVVRAR